VRDCVTHCVISSNNPAGPRYPVYIPSKGRAQIATTPLALDQMGVPWRIIAERAECGEYAARWGEERVLELPQSYLDEYDTLDGRPGGPKGPGAARNFARDHSASEGHAWHWVIDDNVFYFGRLHQNRRVPAGDGLIFAAMESHATRWLNCGMAGPDYWWFVKARNPQAAPFVTNRRVMSCNLIRNATNIRWHGRYNEDVILTLDMLHAAWCTIVFRTFLQFKARTQTMPGGCNKEFYDHEPGGGTLYKSQLLVARYPEDARLQRRFGRVHHWVDYRRYEALKLIPDPDWTPPPPGAFDMREIDAGVTARPSVRLRQPRAG